VLEFNEESGSLFQGKPRSLSGLGRWAEGVGDGQEKRTLFIVGNIKYL
jgi:hypothetical protein